ncbi:hypothetical protein JCM33374_g6266 [Metschnikowia sp. JCM 33374]|nr:hypothetical protein JCM33374_g6266 [Metschnikowia sp. JCM 33374]
MENFTESFAKAKSSVSGTLSQLYSRIQHHIPEEVEQSVRHYIDALSNTSKEDLLNEVRGLQITPATVTLALLAVPTLLWAGRLVGGSHTPNAAGEGKSKTKKKKQTKAQKANKEIQKILDFVEETYVPQIDSYIENYADLSEEDQAYKYKYFEEMLLKELMNLDNVDVAGNDVLRENRKKVIRFIQDHQKRLDIFRKEN